jgi:aminopeptidase N
VATGGRPDPIDSSPLLRSACLFPLPVRFPGVGTYQAYRGEVEYCDGATFTAELLVFPGLVEQRHAQTALQSLIDSILWCYLSTGPEATEHENERARIYSLLPVRDALKAKKAAGQLSAAEEEQLAAVRAELKQLIGVWGKTGYAYTGAIYREISMQNSDYGGMENVGTTSAADAARSHAAIQ